MKNMVLILVLSISTTACSIDATMDTAKPTAQEIKDQTRDYAQEAKERQQGLTADEQEQADNYSDSVSIRAYRHQVQERQHTLTMKELDQLYYSTLKKLKTDEGRSILSMDQIAALGVIKE